MKGIQAQTVFASSETGSIYSKLSMEKIEKQ